MRKLLVAVVLLLLLPGVASAGGGGGISHCAGFAAGTTVSMLDSCFNGTAHFAPPGTALTIENAGGLPHTFTAVDGTFHSGQVQPGEIFALTIDEPGVYEVFCSLHGTADGQGMAGVLVVEEAELSPVAAAVNTYAVDKAVVDDPVVVEALDRRISALESLEATSDRIWIPTASGLAIGLALAALLVSQLSRRRLDPPAIASWTGSGASDERGLRQAHE